MVPRASADQVGAKCVGSRPVLGKSVCLGAPSALHRTAVEGRPLTVNGPTRQGTESGHAMPTANLAFPVPFSAQR